MRLKTIILSSVAVLAAFFIFGWIGYLNIGHWLSLDEAPHSANAIICLASGNGRQEKSISLLSAGFADKIMATTDKTYIGLINKKINKNDLVRPEKNATTTYEEALFLKRKIIDLNIKSALIVSDPFHLYRVRWTFTHVYKNIPVRFFYISTDPTWAKGFWWDNSRSRVFVLLELTKIPYYWIVHGIFGLDHDPAWVVVVKRWYERELMEIFQGRRGQLIDDAHGQ
ncbi:MAG: YdcF family protein [Gammaproteobacteria bacterium]|nr:YdcF family protein [Gammaproteobacteria bacterium]